jgi:hypothetical protein
MNLSAIADKKLMKSFVIVRRLKGLDETLVCVL